MAYDLDVLAQVRRLVRTIAPGDRFSVLTFDPDDPIGVQPQLVGSQLGLSDLGRALMRRVLAGNSIVVFEDLAADEELRAVAAEHGIAAAIGLPIFVRGRVVGVASVFLDDAEPLSTPAGGEVLARLREEVVKEAAPREEPPRREEPAEPAPASSAHPSHIQAGETAKPLVDLVAAVMGEAVSRLDSEFGRAEEMSEANRLKTEFISVISHELRSPLTYVLGFSEILSERELTAERVHHIAGEMHRESRRMLQLVDDLLDISRMEAGRYTIDPQPVHMAQEIAQLVSNMSTTIDKHRLVPDCPPDLIAMADPVRVWQVLQNLASNAVRYSPAGGTVTIRARATADGMAQVEVIDQGIGIPKEEQPRIFEKFYRVDSELKTRVRGSGLGLAICRAIVESHGGRIWIESEPGQGSTFAFTLPLGSPVAAAPVEAEGITA